jgi:hypothetical protein
LSSPIAILYDKITSFFAQGAMAQKLQYGLNSGALSPAIRIDVEGTKIITPFADPYTRQINLHQNFLCYLWAICYCMNAFNRMAFEQALEHRMISLSRSPEAPVVNRLFDWAAGLGQAHEDWPEGLPIPGCDNEWVVETDSLFLFAIRYIMYHEVAHLIFHTNSAELLSRNVAGGLNADDRRRFLAMENQADDYAIDITLATFPGEEYRYMNLLGAAIALLSMFFLRADDDLRGGRTHPDTDDRLKRLLKRAKFDFPGHSIFLDYTVTTGLQVFFTRHQIQYLPADQEAWHMEAFDELYQMLYDKVMERKNLYDQFYPIKVS